MLRAVNKLKQKLKQKLTQNKNYKDLAPAEAEAHEEAIAAMKNMETEIKNKTIRNLLKGLKDNGIPVDDVQGLNKLQGTDELLKGIPSIIKFYESVHDVFNNNQNAIKDEIPQCRQSIDNIISYTNQLVANLKRLKADSDRPNEAYNRLNQTLLITIKNFEDKISTDSNTRNLAYQCWILRVILESICFNNVK